MRVLLQRVSRAHVSVNGQVVGSIGQGFVALVGVTQSDSSEEARWIANKIAGLRLFEDREGKMNISLNEIDGSVLVISQFTLYGDARKGRRPSFTKAARPEHAEPLIDLMVAELQHLGINVETGIFGAMMEVAIFNDGPVTLMLEH